MTWKRDDLENYGKFTVGMAELLRLQLPLAWRLSDLDLKLDGTFHCDLINELSWTCSMRNYQMKFYLHHPVRLGLPCRTPTCRTSANANSCNNFENGITEFTCGFAGGFT
jgi:hypothetical protein